MLTFREGGAALGTAHFRITHTRFIPESNDYKALTILNVITAHAVTEVRYREGALLLCFPCFVDQKHLGALKI